MATSTPAARSSPSRCPGSPLPSSNVPVTSSARSHAQALEAVVAAMDRLRSPGGCPWDAEQTHRSLAPYAIEEAYELAEAAESVDRAALRGALGELLLQVVFHARVAEEHPEDPFSLDDVARVLHV